MFENILFCAFSKNSKSYIDVAIYSLDDSTIFIEYFDDCDISFKFFLEKLENFKKIFNKNDIVIGIPILCNFNSFEFRRYIKKKPLQLFPFYDKMINALSKNLQLHYNLDDNCLVVSLLCLTTVVYKVQKILLTKLI